MRSRINILVLGLSLGKTIGELEISMVYAIDPMVYDQLASGKLSKHRYRQGALSNMLPCKLTKRYDI